MRGVSIGELLDNESDMNRSVRDIVLETRAQSD